MTRWSIWLTVCSLPFTPVGLTAAPGPGTTASVPSDEPNLEGVARTVKNLPVFSLICTGTVSNETIMVGTGPFAQACPRIRIGRVFFGDPDVDEIVADRWSVGLQAGKSYLLFAQGRSRVNRVIEALPGTPKVQEQVRAAIIQKLRLQEEEAQESFTDISRSLDAAEGLLLEYLRRVSQALPEHPYLGREATAGLKIRRIEFPPGVYVRIEGGMLEVETSEGRRPIPQSRDGILLWVGFGVDRGRHFMIGAPAYPWNEAVYAHASAPTEAGGDQLTVFRRDALFRPSGVFTLCLELEEPYVRNGTHEVSDKLIVLFHGLRELYQDLCTRPPQDVDAALDCLRSLSAQQAVTSRPLAHRIFPAFLAYKALDKEFVSGRMTDEQRRRVVPALIGLLTDRTIVADETPYDGPITRSHHMAYPLLTAITGQTFPAPLPSKPTGGRTPAFLLDSQPENDREAKNVAERLDAWKKWWQAQDAAHHKGAGSGKAH